MRFVRFHPSSGCRCSERALRSPREVSHFMVLPVKCPETEIRRWGANECGQRLPPEDATQLKELASPGGDSPGWFSAPSPAKQLRQVRVNDVSTSCWHFQNKSFIPCRTLEQKLFEVNDKSSNIIHIMCTISLSLCANYISAYYKATRFCVGHWCTNYIKFSSNNTFALFPYIFIKLCYLLKY